MRVDESNLAEGETPAVDAAAAVADSTTATDAGKGEGQGDAGKEGEQGKDAAVDGKAEGEGDGADKGDGEQPVVPEKYTVPEGVTVSDGRLEFYSVLAKDAGFTQEQFDQSIAQAESLRAKEREFERGEWRLQSEDEFGKDFEGITTGAERALVELEKERPGITDRLDATNLGNHPDVLWLSNKIGTLLKPKKMDGIETEGSAQQPRSIEERLWGNKS
jgi:hypothetical protein